jgi:hypothetical protein|tara:strand:- start:1797 stop:2048 length:252 start_codon:yes stop_codon:yes gene_type:complete
MLRPPFLLLPFLLLPFLLLLFLLLLFLLLTFLRLARIYPSEGNQQQFQDLREGDDPVSIPFSVTAQEDERENQQQFQDLFQRQ